MENQIRYNKRYANPNKYIKKQNRLKIFGGGTKVPPSEWV